MLIISAVMGVLLLLAFRYTSNQQAIRRVRETITAELLAAKLFKDDIRVTLRAQGQLVAQSFRLLFYMLRPLAVIIVPMVLFLVQMGVWYEWRPVRPGEKLIVSVELEDTDDLTSVADPPAASPGLRVETAALRIRNSAKVEWRVSAQQEGQHELRVRVGQQELVVPIMTSQTQRRVVRRIPGEGFWDQVINPGQRALTDGGLIHAVEVRYPVRSTPILGLDIHWIVSFFILSTIVALIFKPVFKVYL
jgi:hypothetical protein